MKRKMTKLVLSVVFLVGCVPSHPPAKTDPPPPGTFGYIERHVYLPPNMERELSDLYDGFLSLMVGGEIAQGVILPDEEQFCRRTDTHAVFAWSYYISPNELRGFEIGIPTQCLQRVSSGYQTTVALAVDQRIGRQGIAIITMKERPNHTSEGIRRPADGSPKPSM